MKYGRFGWILLLWLAITAARAQHYVNIYIEQDGHRQLVNNRTVTLERKPFTLIFEFLKPEKVSGIYVNTSFKPKPYFTLLPSQQIPDFDYVPRKVFSEYKFNPNKELKVHSEFFQYWEYNPLRNWNKFDRIVRQGDRILAYRRVERLDVVEERRRVELGKNRFPLYLFFGVIVKDPNHFGGLRELERIKVKIKFR